MYVPIYYRFLSLAIAMMINIEMVIALLAQPRRSVMDVLAGCAWREMA